MLIAIDHGNSLIKTPVADFVSGVMEHSVKPPVTDEVLTFQGRYWTKSGKRLSYMRDKTRDEKFFILTLFAIAMEMERKGKYAPLEHIQLAVGLPPEHYGILRDKFAEYFKNRGLLEFHLGERFYRIQINDVFVFPQAYAAVVPRSATIVKSVMVFIIDIGGYTTDVLLLRNGKPDMQFCRSLETGIITMNNEIIRRVSALHDMRIEDEHIRAVLMNEAVILPEEIKETIRMQAREHTQDILNQLRELQIDLRANPSVFLGGGGVALKQYIEESPLVNQTDFIEDGHANAIGYELLAQAMVTKKK